MHDMRSAPPAGLWRAIVGSQQVLGRQAEPLDGCMDFRPLFAEELLALAPQQQVPRAYVDEHAAAPLLVDKLFALELLVGLEDRQRIDPGLRGDGANRR